MLSLHNILSIAKYESKTLVRSWFFRIFAGLTLVILFFLNFGLLTEAGGNDWGLRAIPSAIPYANILILNITQAIIAVFLASDFLKRDKKLDTTEVIYMRSMTNGEYVIGKTLGNLFIFIIINIIILLIALIFNMVASDTYVDWSSYVTYFLLMSLPTLIFILGLSFLLMSLIRNQAITFILLLGYIATVLFYLGGKYYYLFDYMNFYFPMLDSQFTGFSNLPVILGQRGIYLFFGLGAISLTIFKLKRLPQSKGFTVLSLILGIIFFAASFFLGYKHVSRYNIEENLRNEMVALNNTLAGQPVLSVTDHNINFEHKDNTIAAISALTVVNRNSKPLETFIFSLNPGLTVNDVKINGRNVTFERKLHIIEVKPGKALAVNDNSTIEITYAGEINEAICYLDIDKETRLADYSYEMIHIDKRSAFVTPSYLLLTPESCWYPVTGVTYSSTDPHWYHKDFTNFTLNVSTTPGLTAISQGEMNKISDGIFGFKPEYALPQLSLTIGDYEQKSFEKDSIMFSIWHKKGHDFFTDALPEIADTIPDIIAERLHDFEREHNLEYPFKRLSIVEVPAQFVGYERIWTSAQETTQPEMILFQEKGAFIRNADFKGRLKREKRRSRRHDESLTDEEYQERVLNNFLATFTEKEGRSRWTGRRGGGFRVEESINPYFQFAQLYSFSNYLDSKEWPIANRVLEAYLVGNEAQRGGFDWARNMNGVSEDELANMALQEKTFAQLLTDNEQKEILDNIIALKGDVLFSLIQTQVGDDEFKDFLQKLIRQYRHKPIDFALFDRHIKDAFGIELTPFMKAWFEEKNLPKYLVGEVDAEKVQVGDQIQTMVSFNVSNYSLTEGILKVSFRLGQGGRGHRSRRDQSAEDDIQKLIYLDANQTKSISYLLDAEPRMMVVNTLASGNLPSVITTHFRKIEENKKATPFNGEKVIAEKVTLTDRNEIIADNEDSGFSVQGKSEESRLRKWLIPDEDQSDYKYAGFAPWRPPLNWTPNTNSGYFGKFIRSAHCIKSGDGTSSATWKAPIKEGAYYDVYYHVYKDVTFRWNEDQKGEYHFTIQHDDGEDNPVLEIHNAENGWAHLGSYYFSPDSAVITLNNDSELRSVIADAVKLVKQ